MLLVLPLNPVPASRPRLARNGRVFYAKTYANFKKQAAVVVPVAMKFQELEGCPLEGPLMVDLRFYTKRPKKTILQFPRYDVDNAAKACLDELQGPDRLFVDDNQVVVLTAMKTWAEPEQEGWIEVRVEPYWTDDEHWEASQQEATID
jgi:Holliday junction resolvase RusA-like endonuclease